MLIFGYRSRHADPSSHQSDALELGPLKVHWYGLTYLAAFATFYFLANWRARRPPLSRPAGIDRRSKTCCFGVLGVVLGGRLGCVLFTNLPITWLTQLEIFAVWRGGMAFHGGLLGVILAMYLYGRKVGRPFRGGRPGCALCTDRFGGRSHR